MDAILWLVIVATVGIGVYALSLFGVIPPFWEELIKKSGSKSSRIQEENKDQKIVRLEGRVAALEGELQKTTAGYTSLQNDLEAAKKREADLKDQLVKREEWVRKGDDISKKVQEKFGELETKAKDKDKESQEIFAKNVDLTRQLRETQERIKALEEENKSKSDEIEAQKHKIERYVEEAKAQDSTLAELKKKQEESEWVPKKEFNRLNEEYTELEKDLEKKEEQIKALRDEIVRLNAQHLGQPQLPEAPPQQETIQPQQGEVVSVPPEREEAVIQPVEEKPEPAVPQEEQKEEEQKEEEAVAEEPVQAAPPKIH
ncbi:MAG: hypothetical protein ACM3IL_05495, partial [Deltaproteobacteria bacterium]